MTVIHLLPHMHVQLCSQLSRASDRVHGWGTAQFGQTHTHCTVPQNSEKKIVEIVIKEDISIDQHFF